MSSLFSKPKMPEPQKPPAPDKNVPEDAALAAAAEKRRRLRAYGAGDTILSRGSNKGAVTRKTLLGE